MKKIFLNGLLAFLFTILFSSSVLAQNKKMVSLPLYIAQEDLEIVDEITIEKDVIVISNDLKMLTNVEGDAYVAGGKLEIGGNINGNLTIAGGVVTIRGKVAKNLIVAGGQVIVAETAEIGGYVLGAGTKIDLEGKFLGPVKLWAQALNVDKEATIAGNLEANVVEKEISPDSKIKGEKKITVRIAESKEERLAKITKKTRENFIWSYLSSIILLFFFVKFFGDKIKGQEVKTKLGLIMKKGLIVLIATPFISLALFLSMLGIPSAILIFIIYLATLFVSEIVASLAIGKYLAEKYQFKANLFIHASLILLVIRLIQSATFLNFFGWIFQLLVMAFGVGIVYLAGKNLIAKR